MSIHSMHALMDASRMDIHGHEPPMACTDSRWEFVHQLPACIVCWYSRWLTPGKAHTCKELAVNVQGLATFTTREHG